MSVYLLCEKALNLIHATSLRDITATQKDMLEAYEYQELVEDHAPEEAIACALFFESVRDGLLHTYPWVFARATAKLVTPEQSPPVAGWLYKFALPEDCVKLLGIIEKHKTARDHEQIENTVECDVSPAVIRYTTRVTNTTKWPMLFQDAFCARLALEIEPSIGGAAVTANSRNYLMQMFQYAISEGYRTGIISPGIIMDNYMAKVTKNTTSLYPPVAQEGQIYGGQMYGMPSQSQE